MSYASDGSCALAVVSILYPDVQGAGEVIGGDAIRGKD